MDVDDDVPTRVAALLDGEQERRFVPADSFDVRADDDEGQLSVVGHATVFDTPYEMFGGPDKGGWTEEIAEGAFTKTLREGADVNFLVNHRGMSLARTKSGTLRLAEDDIGLRTEADLDLSNSAVADLQSALDRGDIDEMSFAFRVVRQEWDDEFTERRIVEVNLNRGDVSAVNYGANDNTSIGARQLVADLQRVGADQLAAEVRNSGGDLEQLRGHLEELLAHLEDDQDTAAGDKSGRTRMPLDVARALAEQTRT